MADTGQNFIRRNRAPRVHISYQDPYDADRQVELPFVMGVLADLSGNNSAVEKPDLIDRKFLEFDMDNFDQRMAAIAPSVKFNVDNKLGDGGDKLSVELHFKSIQDFSPGAVAKQVPSLAALLEARQQLANLLRYMDGKAAASNQIKSLLSDPQLMAALKDRLSERAGPGEAEQ